MHFYFYFFIRKRCKIEKRLLRVDKACTQKYIYIYIYLKIKKNMQYVHNTTL